MDALALNFYVVFFFAAFGWRTWVQWRRTGDAGLRLHAERGTVKWWAKLAFILALAAGVAAPLAGLAGLDPLDALDNAGLRALGVVVAVAGIGATLASQWSMGASWRIGVDDSERTGLVTTGVFRHIRNPIFTAMTITALGLALMVGNLVAVAGLVALAAALQLQVRLVEEPYLRSTHSYEYDRYAATAGRFLPLLGRLREPNQQPPETSMVFGDPENARAARLAPVRRMDNGTIHSCGLCCSRSTSSASPPGSAPT